MAGKRKDAAGGASGSGAGGKKARGGDALAVASQPGTLQEVRAPSCPHAHSVTERRRA